MNPGTFPFYTHFRRMEDDGNGGKRQASKYAVTVCILESMNSDIYYVGVAVCGPHDHFCKKMGRDIARGRAESGICDILEYTDMGVSYNPPVRELISASRAMAQKWIREHFRERDARAIVSDVFR